MTTAPPLVTSAPTTIPFTASTSFAPCTWMGHCLGSPCSSWDDCDNDWVCKEGICSPCCLTGFVQSSRSTASSVPSTTSSTASSNTTTSTSSDNGPPTEGLSTGATVGISVAVVFVVGVFVMFGIWMFFKRRQSNQEWAPPSSGQPTPYYGAEAPGTSLDDHKKLVGGAPVELAVPNRPVESSAVELVELEGDYDARVPPYHDMYKSVKEPHDQGRKRSSGQRFDE